MPALAPRVLRPHEPPTPFATFQNALFDLGSVIVGFSMVMFARRFAPLFYILSAPVLALWTVTLVRGLSADLQRRLRGLVLLAIWPALAMTVYVTATRAYEELVTNVQTDADYSLLHRVTRFDVSLRNTIDFLSKNKLSASALVEWTQAGPMMFYAPTVKVFIDGRSQQVFDEEHYLLQMWIMNFSDSDEGRVLERLKAFGTDLVALRKTPAARRLTLALSRSPDWALVMGAPQEVVFVRRKTPLIEEMGRRERAHDLWWPDCAEAEAGRGLLLMVTEPTDPDRAIALWRAAVARDPTVGVQCYQWMTSVLRDMGGRRMKPGRTWKGNVAGLATPDSPCGTTCASSS